MPAGGIFAVVLTAAVLFASTNADDILVLTVLNVSSRADGRPRRWQIWAGQYAGFAVLVAASLAAAVGLTLVPVRWLWLLGSLPLGLGLGKLAAPVRAHRSGRYISPAVATGPARPQRVGPASRDDRRAAGQEGRAVAASSHGHHGISGEPDCLRRRRHVPEHVLPLPRLRQSVQVGQPEHGE